MMEVVIGGRQTGKTQKLLEWAAAQPEGEARVIVSHSFHASMDLLRRAREAGINVESWQFVSVHEMKERGGGWMNGVGINRRVIRYSLDNADIVLQDLIGAPITIATVTGRASALSEPSTEKCLTCEGAGRVSLSAGGATLDVATRDGQGTCPTCHGSGSTPTTEAPK